MARDRQPSKTAARPPPTPENRTSEGVKAATSEAAAVVAAAVTASASAAPPDTLEAAGALLVELSEQLRVLKAMKTADVAGALERGLREANAVKMGA